MIKGKEKELKMKLIIEALEFGADISGASAHASVSRDTYYKWLEEDPVFANNVDKSKEVLCNKAIKTINNNIDDPCNAKWLLERRKRKRFSTRQEVTGADGKDLNGSSQEMLGKLDSILDKID